jgi:hypothetical protein
MSLPLEARAGSSCRPTRPAHDQPLGISSAALTGTPRGALQASARVRRRAPALNIPVSRVSEGVRLAAKRPPPLAPLRRQTTPPAGEVVKRNLPPGGPLGAFIPRPSSSTSTSPKSDPSLERTTLRGNPPRRKSAARQGVGRCRSQSRAGWCATAYPGPCSVRERPPKRPNSSVGAGAQAPY